MKKRYIIGAISFFLILLLSGSLIISLNKQPAKKVKHPQKISLVAIGDSLTYGEQDPAKSGGYVSIIKQKLEKHYKIDVNTTNFGKTGDRTDQIQNRITDDKDIQQKIKEANVITMTFGGNDLMQVLQNNFNDVLDNRLAQIMPNEEKKYRKKVETLLNQVRKLNPKASIFVFSIYNPFYVYFPTITDLQKFTDQWVDVTQEVVDQHSNMYFVNVNQRLSQGQFLNRNQDELKKKSKMNLQNLSSSEIEKTLNDNKEINDYLSSNDHFHPNLKGYRYMADQLYKTMLKYQKEWFN